MRYFTIIILFLFASCANQLTKEELEKRLAKAYEVENWVAVVELLDEVILREPDFKKHFLSRAIAKSRLQAKNQQSITKDLSIYLEDFPNDDVVRVLKFQSLFMQGDYNEALDEVDIVINSKGKSPYVLAWKGNIAFAAQKFDISEHVYEERLRLSGSYEDLKNTYYYWMFSKYFSGNKEGAIWDCAFLNDRGFKEDNFMLKTIENDELDFNQLAIFYIPQISLDDIEKAISNNCSDLDIFSNNSYYRSELAHRFYRLEKVTNLNSLLEQKENVVSLNLSATNLKELPKEITQFKNLQYLNLSNNRFKDKDALFKLLAELPNLTFLEMNRCYLRELPDSIKNLKNLQLLSLEFNDFKTLNENIGYLSKLKYLDIGSNGKLRDLPKSIGNLKCLQMLEVSPNGLSRLRDELSLCTQLVSIVGNAGTIKSLPTNVKGLINLKHVNLAANKINSLPKDIGELSSLEYLSLGTNDVKELPNSFSKLGQLKSFNLAYNRINVFPNEIMALENLESLWLHNNSFKEIPLELSKLTKLSRLLVDHQIITDRNISLLKEHNPKLNIARNDTRRYVKGPKRKN